MVTRYNVYPPSGSTVIEKDVNGLWVTHADYKALEEERKADIADLLSHSDKYKSALREAGNEIERLTAELAECRADAKRMNFLATPGIELVQEFEDDQFHFVVYREYGGRNDREWDVLGKDEEDHRKAIDQAINRSKA